MLMLMFGFLFCYQVISVSSSPSGSSSSSNNNNNNPYRILGVSQNSSTIEIQRGYKKMCLKYHPDKNINKSKKERDKCEEMFKRVQHAYTLIKDPIAKAKYDQFGDTTTTATTTTKTSRRSSYYSFSPSLPIF